MSGDPIDQSDLPGDVPLEPAASVACWRCGKEVEATHARCPFCAAKLATVHAPAQPAPATGDGRSSTVLVRTLVVFMAMLATSLVGGWLAFGAAILRDHGKEPPAGEELVLVGILEAIDTVLVLGALVLIRPPWRMPRKPLSRRLLAWAGCLPLLVLLLAINLSYHEYLLRVLHLREWQREAIDDPGLLPWVIALICVQPAIVEELFFRYLALGALRSVVGPHAAVVVSSVMFAMAHLGVPLSLPVLFVLGIGLGYARLWSGGMLLPMIMHGLHNAAVLAMPWILLHL
jgi:uncharacterized protein